MDGNGTMPRFVDDLFNPLGVWNDLQTQQFHQPLSSLNCGFVMMGVVTLIHLILDRVFQFCLMCTLCGMNNIVTHWNGYPLYGQSQSAGICRQRSAECISTEVDPFWSDRIVVPQTPMEKSETIQEDRFEEIWSIHNTAGFLYPLISLILSSYIQGIVLISVYLPFSNVNWRRFKKRVTSIQSTFQNISWDLYGEFACLI